MKGQVVYQYASDVANEIVTSDLREILASASTPIKLREEHTFPRESTFYAALTAELSRPVRMNGTPARVVVRVFEVGVVSISIHVPFQVESVEQLLPFHQPMLDDGTPLNEAAAQLCREVCDSIRDSLIRSSAPSPSEAYTVFCVSDLENAQEAAAWLEQHRRELAGLFAECRGEELSEAQVAEALRIVRSYTRRDLVVIDWDASLVIDQDGYFDDVLYVLELANVQLEEFRVMDQRLDRHLERAYRDLERYKSARWGAPTAMLDWLRRFRVDVTKLADEATHITKFLGDWYLARVYLGAQERFHLTQWQESVQQRLGQLDEVYRLLQSEVYERRMLWLEIAVVVCFIVDLLGLFFWKS